MWGNGLGWAISGLMLLLAGWGIYGLEQLGRTTPPTALAREPQNLSRMHLPISPLSVGTFMTGPCDSGAEYRQAIEAYQSDPRPIDGFVANPGSGRIPEHPALDLVRRAAGCQRANIFLVRPEAVVNYDRRRRELEGLHAVGHALVLAGMLRHQSDPAEARRDLEAAFSLGYKLFEERLVYAQLDRGLELMSSASVYLARLAKAEGDDAQAEQWRQFETALKAFRLERADPMWAVISSIGERSIADHAGDVFVFASDRMEEPMWRAEAILKLGRYQYNAPRRSDQVAAERTVRELAGHPDPLLSAAGVAARDLTIQQYRQLGAARR